MSHPDQTLKRQLDSALREIQEHKDTSALFDFKHTEFIDSCLSQVLHLAITLSRNSLRTQHGIICPDCKQEVAHACYLHSSSSLQPPLHGYEHQPASTLANPGLQTHFTGPTAQENVFGNIRVTAAPFDTSTSPVQPHIPTSVPRLTTTPPSLTASNLCIPSFNNSFQPPATILSASGLSSSVPEPLAALAEDGEVTSEEESGAGWSITYNSEVKRALSVSLIRSLDVGPEFRIGCLKFSKDGK